MNGSLKGRKRVLVVDPTCGMSGDMFLAALFAMGAGIDRVTEELKKLEGIEDFDIRLEKVQKKGLVASRAVISCAESHHERDLKSIIGMIESSSMNEKVKDLSGKIFSALAEAEGKVHGVPPDEVHFHEVGAVDSIIDIVGSVLALEELGFPEMYHRPFVLGKGTIEIEHGRIPLPAPATMELLRGRKVSFVDEPFEIATPTAAALMKVLAREAPSGFSFVPERIFYTTGTREEKEARSLLRVIEALFEGYPYGDVVVVRTVIDDLNPELFGYVQEGLLRLGARDAFLTHVIMKKGRPGVELTVLCREEGLRSIVDFIAGETTTTGMRISYERRIEFERWSERLQTQVGVVEVKFCRMPDATLKGAPEYESCREIALKSGVPLRDVYSKVQVAIDSYIASREKDGDSGR